MKHYPVLLFITSILALSASCEYDNPLAVYMDVDFIADSSLEDWTPGGTDAGFAQVTAPEAGDISALPTGAEVFRLELDNLAGNGDFEDGSTVGWVNTGTIGNYTGVPVTSGAALRYVMATSTEDAVFDLDVSSGSSYYLLFDFIVSASGGTGKYDFSIYDTAASSETVSVDGADIADGTAFTNEWLSFTSGSGNEEFVIRGTEQEGYLDNLRLVRIDPGQEISFEVPYMRNADDELPLLNAVYTFSIWVKNEDSAYLTPTVRNRFPARGLTLAMEGIADNGCSGQATVFVTEEELTDVWTEFSVHGSMGIAVQEAPAAVTDPYPPVIRLRITPRDESAAPGYYDIGSILIAAPSLVISSSRN
ncbi:MAG: hypothetical protein JXB03_03245 [Spirochaetales bacterium]|nr:hypothetical protein [Spirochaetales bacterium]